jgi:hypothetical protein
VRAAHFEGEIQKVIDRSQWNPDNALRQVRGRALRLNGQTITDIDAVGSQNGTMLLVSAKSRVHTARYDAGDHKQVRNTAEAIERRSLTGAA